MPHPPLRPVLVLLFGALVLSATPAASEELPPGFTDGVPVAAEAGTPGAVTAAGTVGAAATQRHFGAGAYLAVRNAVAATSRACAITDDVLTALVLAPVFKESSAATTPSTAPSPMTLSRYDEWNGVQSTTMGTPENNYGLYAFRNPSTPYRRAFWSPGIGIWQYDSAGLGAPLTTIEAMDVTTVASDVARVMSARYCNPSASLIGHPAPFTAQERRYSAWGDWGYPCTLCQGFFDEMMGTTPPFDDLVLVGGITALGGVESRTCALSGGPSTFPCWYVNPAVGVIQGATAWATLSPADGGSPTVAPTPLSLPFYVVDQGTTEERHWLRADTGYGIDIRASRQIGRNARPVSTQAGSGLTWTSGSSLCDVTKGRGTCGPIAPAGFTTKSFPVTGSYRPTALDANGDGQGDILWYAPGGAADSLWLSTGPGTFSAIALNVTRSYSDVHAFDADGDGDDDLLWYDRATGATALWRFAPDGSFASSSLAPGSGRTPLFLNLNSNPATIEVFWYGPGGLSDFVWGWTGAGFTSTPRTVNLTYQPVTGDFDDNGRDDIVWYAPGGAADSVWFHGVAGGVNVQPFTVNAKYQTLAGDFDGDGADDLFWYSPGTAADAVWFGEGDATFATQTMAVNRTYQPVVAGLDDGGDDLIWYAHGAATDALWSWTSGRSLSTQPLILAASQQPLVGPFSAGGADGIFWYGAGTAVDLLWYR